MYMVVPCRKSVHAVNSLSFLSIMLFKTSAFGSMGNVPQWLSLLFSSTGIRTMRVQLSSVLKRRIVN